MSTVKANQYQIGSDIVVPNNNFVLKTDGAGNLIVNTGNYNGVLTPVATFGPTGVLGSSVAYTPYGAGAVTTTVQTKLRQGISAADFGAVGDNVTDDTSKFTALETADKGEIVNLLGKTYLVTSLPTGCKYYNGSFRVGTSTYTQPITPLAHPLDGDVTAVMEDKRAHFWPGPVGQPASGDVLINCYTQGWRHSVALNAIMLSQSSYDGGLTWESPRTVYSNALYEPRGLVGGMITTSRFGVFFVEVNSAGTIAGTKFAYSDDSGATWTTVSIATTSMYPHGEFVVDDSGGINVFGYGGNNIYRARTTDNGATWTVTLAKAAAAPVTQPTEPTVVKVGTSKYLMFVRNDAGGNMYASSSTDLATWTAWADTGIPLGTNPPLAMIAWGKLWLYLSARRGTPISGWEDKMLVAELNPDTVYAAGGAVTGTTPLRVAFASKTAMIGYLTVSQLRNGSYLGFMVDGETSTGSNNPMTTRIVKVGGFKGISSAPALLQRRRTQPPITHNPTFNHWTRGSSFTAIATTTAVADRWMVARSTSNIDVVRVEVDDTVRKILPACGRYALNIQGIASGSGRLFFQRFYGKDRIIPMLDRIATMNCILRGTLPGYFRARVVLNFGTGGSATQIVDFTDCAQRVMVGDLTLLTGTGYTPNADGATWGTDPYIQFTLLSNDAGAANANLYALWWDWADGYIPLDPLDYDAERSTIDQYTQRLSFGASDWVSLARGNGTANTEIDLKFKQMVVQPVITGDAASNLTVNGTALNAISFDLISPQAARMIGTLSSGTLTGNNVGVCSVTGAGAWSFLADVGY